MNVIFTSNERNNHIITLGNNVHELELTIMDGL